LKSPDPIPAAPRDDPPEGYLGTDALISSGPAPELVASGYALETADAPLLHRGLGLADLAHVVALRDADVISAEVAGVLARELLQMLDTPASDFPYDTVYGDAYNSRERELERRIGHTAGWLHTGRTRREAGRIAFRIALRSRLLDLHAVVASFVSALGAQASRHATTLWADTTYLQPAQPSTFGHYLGSFAEEAVRHLERIERAHAWANRSPSGSGGVGGSKVLTDRPMLAGLLGFAEAGAHTRDAMWAVDGLVDAVVAATQAATTVDRLAEDLEIFASPAFGYISLDASLCRASVLMPQKRNPYALAVIRAGAGTLVGRATGLMVTQRTPSARTDNWLHAYGEVASSLELAHRIVALGGVAVRTLTVHEEVLHRAAGVHFTGAADLAEELVTSAHLDYRSSYRVVGRAVALAVADGRGHLASDDLDLAAEELLGHRLDDASGLLGAGDPEVIVASRNVLGGSAPAQVVAHAESVLGAAREAGTWNNATRASADDAEHRLVARARGLAT
jgi:argininosuccinate lyase